MGEACIVRSIKREEMTAMEREQLERYRSQKEEIRELRYKLEHLGEGDSLVGNTIIFDYKTGFPKPKAVIGYDHDKEQRLRERYETQMRKMEKDCEETERWVESIPESQTRRIFRMRFIEGDTQQKIGEKLHMDRSTVSKRIEAFLKVSHKSHNSHL